MDIACDGPIQAVNRGIYFCSLGVINLSPGERGNGTRYDTGVMEFVSSPFLSVTDHFPIA